MDLRALADRLLEEFVTAEELAAFVGLPAERQSRRLRLRPADPRFREGWLGLDPTGGPSAPPLYVELWTSPALRLRVPELDRAFGKPEAVPPLPDGHAFILAYRIDRPGLPRKVLAFAALTGDPGTAVERLVLRREPRL